MRRKTPFFCLRNKEWTPGKYSSFKHSGILLLCSITFLYVKKTRKIPWSYKLHINQLFSGKWQAGNWISISNWDIGTLVCIFWQPWIVVLKNWYVELNSCIIWRHMKFQGCQSNVMDQKRPCYDHLDDLSFYNKKSMFLWNSNPETSYMFKSCIDIFQNTKFSNLQFRVAKKCIAGCPYLSWIWRFNFQLAIKSLTNI